MEWATVFLHRKISMAHRIAQAVCSQSDWALILTHQFTAFQVNSFCLPNCENLKFKNDLHFDSLNNIHCLLLKTFQVDTAQKHEKLLTVAENIVLGAEKTKGIKFDLVAAEKEVIELSIKFYCIYCFFVSYLTLIDFIFIALVVQNNRLYSISCVYLGLSVLHYNERHKFWQ